MMPALAHLQRKFLDYLHDRSGSLHEAIAPGGRIEAGQRLDIYRHAYRARLIEVLQDVFERTWTYLGDDGFAEAADAYITAHPPGATTLQDFGQSLPSWLRQRFPDDTDIAEVAMIDAMLRTAFEGGNATPLALANFVALTAEDWARIRFEFHPTLRIVPVTHNAAGIWAALESGEPPPAAAELDSPSWLLVWRQELRPHFITVGEIEAEALRQLGRGESFAAVCAEVDARFPETNATREMGVALRRWIGDGLIVGWRDVISTQP